MTEKNAPIYSASIRTPDGLIVEATGSREVVSDFLSDMEAKVSGSTRGWSRATSRNIEQAMGTELDMTDLSSIMFRIPEGWTLKPAMIEDRWMLVRETTNQASDGDNHRIVTPDSNEREPRHGFIFVTVNGHRYEVPATVGTNVDSFLGMLRHYAI